MRSQYGKAFQNILTRKIECFSYDTKQNYYDLVCDISKRGYQQSIFTSSVMISLIEYFLLEYDAVVTDIDFYIEDVDLNQEISMLLDKMKNNGVYWEKLKERLSFLSQCFSIDIKKVDITCKKSNGFLLSLQINGVFVVSENAYNFVSAEIGEIMGRVVA